MISLTPDAARARLVDELRDSGRLTSPTVEAAFRAVPRHLFLPEMAASEAYQDEAFVIKTGADGLPVSSSSQPAIMASMLQLLRLRPGHRVMEVGAGTGYNAALMTHLVGERGSVVTVDIDADIGGIDLADGPLVLVVGSEGRGLSRLVAQRCDVLARIAMPGPAESLNAGVAAGIALYEVARMRSAG